MKPPSTEKYIDYSHKASNLIWILLFAIIATDFYLIQRSFHWNQVVKEKVGVSISDEYADPDFMSIFWETLMQQQSQFNGIQSTLRFNYGSLALLWPLIILISYIILNFLIKRYYNLVTTASEIDTSFDKRLILQYPFSPLIGSSVTATSFNFIVLLLLPIASLTIHAFSGIEVSNEILTSVKNVAEKNFLGEQHAIYDLANKFKFFFRIQFTITIVLLIPLIINNGLLFKHSRKQP